MTGRARTIAMAVLLVAVTCNLALGQAPAGSILHVEIEKSTLYLRGYCGNSDRGQDPNKLPTVPVRGSGGGALGIGDIVSVNGQTVKGTAIEYINGTVIRPDFTPGTPIGDFPANNTATSWELGFLNLDGTAIGTVHIDGNGGGPRAGDPPPPGAPKEIAHSSYTVTGGTGAFFGARGYWDAVQDSVSGERRTTDCEDPAYRRMNADPGGNKRHGILWLVPLVQPQIASTPNGPAVVHSTDFTLVTALKPAAAGEILSLFATGLGPVRPGVDPGQPFPSDTPAAVNSPVVVTVNGKPAEVLAAVGFPGSVDGYQVNFRVPPDTAKGAASIQVSAAWIAGSLVSIAVR